MEKILILTNSMDGTADSLISISDDFEVEIFRWNIDLWRDYDVTVSGSEFSFTDPVGRSVDVLDSRVSLVWRKPFTDLMSFDNMHLDPADQDMARKQVGQLVQSVVAVMKPESRVRLVEPYADRRLPKLYQISEAQKFFSVPPSLFSFKQKSHELGLDIVAKPLGDPSTGEGNIFFTKLVDDSALLRPYPWFLQTAIIGGTDVTCVHILGKNYFFSCDYNRNKSSIDWRVEINTESQSEWRALENPKIPEWSEAVNGYMRKVGLHYGRLDFLLKEETLWFLECNSNGQFGWLDDFEDLPLHREFMRAALSKISSIS